MALIDELKERRKRQTESLATIYEAIRERQEYLRGVEFELEDLDRAIAALEPPAQPHGELRSVPPATVEESGDQLTAQQMTPEQILQTIATLNALDNPDRASEDDGQPDAPDPVLTAFENDHIVERAPLIDAQTCEEVDPHPEPELPEGWERRDAIRKLADKPEIPEGFTKWEGGECPVAPSSALIQFYDRNGGPFIERAFDVEWGHNGVSRDVQIIAYRIITPEAETEGYAPVVDAEQPEQDALGGTYDGGFDDAEQPEPSPYAEAIEKGAITQDEADLLAAAKAELEGSTARMFAQGMMADADRHQSDQRSIVEKIGGLFKREREDA